MIDVVKVHQLPLILQNPDDLKAEALRSIIRSKRGALILQDAQSGERFTPTLVDGRRIALEPLPPS